MLAALLVNLSSIVPAGRRARRQISRTEPLKGTGPPVLEKTGVLRIKR